MQSNETDRADDTTTPTHVLELFGDEQSPEDTVTLLVERDQQVHLDIIIETVIADYANDWSHHDCFLIIENCPRVSVEMLGDCEEVPRVTETHSGTEVEAQLRYYAAVALVETILDREYDDPVANHGLQLR